MNIRLRSVTGENIELVENYRFVELLTSEGEIAAVVYLDDAETAQVVTPDMKKQAEHYAKMFDTSFVKNSVKL